MIFETLQEGLQLAVDRAFDLNETELALASALKGVTVARAHERLHEIREDQTPGLKLRLAEAMMSGDRVQIIARTFEAHDHAVRGVQRAALRQFTQD